MESQIQVYSHIFRYALVDPTNPVTKAQHKKDLAERDKDVLPLDANFFQRIMGKAEGMETKAFEKVVTELKSSLLDGLTSGNISASTGPIQLAAVSDTKFSPPPYGKPLPGWLAFLFFARKSHVQGQLNFEVEGTYVTAEERQNIDGLALKDDAQDIGEAIVEKGQLS